MLVVSFGFGVFLVVGVVSILFFVCILWLGELIGEGVLVGMVWWFFDV